MKKKQYKIPDEMDNLPPIPKWFRKFLKAPKRSVILVSRNYGKNWFYNWWKENHFE